MQKILQKIGMNNEFKIAAEKFANAARHGLRGAELLKNIEDVLSLDENADRPHTLTGMQRCSMLMHATTAAIDEGKIEKAWSAITQATALAPYQENILAMTAAVAACTRREPSAPIVLIISCHQRVEIALKKKLMLQHALGDDFRILIVVGQTTQLRHRSALDKGLLTVDAPDNYESLPLKIRAAFEFVYRNFKTPSSCFKIDEDIEVHNPNELASLMRLLCKSDADYAGFAGNNKTMQERTWHFGKCQDKKLGRRPYTKRFRGCWAYGGLYYMSTRAVQSFVLESLRFADEVAGEMYEDKYIGDTLRECGIRLSALNPEEWLLALRKDWWTVNRAYSGFVLSLK
jgi:hypothetical protein